MHFGLVFGSCSSCLCFASGFLPTPHYCDAVAFGYLIPLCQRLIGDFHPSYVSCLTYNKSGVGGNPQRLFSWLAAPLPRACRWVADGRQAKPIISHLSTACFSNPARRYNGGASYAEATATANYFSILLTFKHKQQACTPKIHTSHGSGSQRHARHQHIANKAFL